MRTPGKPGPQSEHFHAASRVFSSLIQLTPPLTTDPWQPISFSSNFPAFYINGLIQCVLFCVCCFHSAWWLRGLCMLLLLSLVQLFFWLSTSLLYRHSRVYWPIHLPVCSGFICQLGLWWLKPLWVVTYKALGGRYPGEKISITGFCQQPVTQNTTRWETQIQNQLNLCPLILCLSLQPTH